MKFKISIAALFVALLGSVAPAQNFPTSGSTDSAITVNSTGALKAPVTVPPGITFTVASGGVLSLSGNVISNGATLTPTEFSHLDGVQSNVQTQLDT